MRRVVLLLLLFTLLFCSGLIHAQSGFTSVTGQVKDSNSVPYANCSVTANFVDATGVTTRAATINGSPIPSRSIQTACDANGNFTIVVEDSAVVVPLGTTWQFTFSYTQHTTGLPNPAGQPSSPSFTYTAPICPNAGCITGATISITSAISSLIPVVQLLSSPGIFTNTQMNLSNQSIVNNCSPQTEWQRFHPAAFATEAFTGCIIVPNTSTVSETNAVGGYVQSNAVNSAVGGNFQAFCSGVVNGQSCYGAGGVTIDAASSATNELLVGMAAVVTPSNPRSQYGGGVPASLILTSPIGFESIINGTINTAYGAAFDVNSFNLGVTTWNTGFQCRDAACNRSLVVGALCNSGNCSSSGVVFDTYSSGVLQQGFLQSTNDGSLKYANPLNFTLLPLAQAISTSFTTTAAATDNVTVTGMTASGHCYLTATNAGAAGGIASVFISAKTTNQITVTHTATSGWTFDVVCFPQ